MILVLLGTFPLEFKRPLEEIDQLCEEGIITEEVIVQSGHTKFESRFFIMRPFIRPEELTALYQQARLIISHAGTGSLVKGLKLKKKIIAIPRLAKYGEVVDDHQVEILNEFSNLNYLIPWTENDDLKELITRVENFSPSCYISQKDKIITYLSEYIDSL